jgi:Tol biopolymer transport system component
MTRLVQLLAAAVLVAAPLALSAQSGTDLFQKALSKERAEGQLTEAIQIYAQIVKDFASDRPLAAKSLLQMGRCYERLGRSEAQQAYERLLREYSDQRAPADDARARLAALVRSDTRPSGGPVTRRVWGGADVDTFGSVSPDGRHLTFTDWETGDLAIRDLESGKNRRLTGKTSWTDSSEFAEFSTMAADGNHIAYAWSNTDGFYELRVIGRHSGPARVLYRNAEVPYLQPFEWSRDKKHILATFQKPDRTHQIVLVSALDGAARVLKTLDWRAPAKMAFSPDGRFIVYDFPQAEDGPERDLFLLAVDGSRELPLVAHRAHDFLLGWFPGGDRVLFASDRQGTTGVWSIRVDPNGRHGEAELLKPQMGRVGAMAFTAAGKYFYGLTTAVREVSVAARDRVTGQLLEPLAPLKGRLEEGKFAGVWSPNGAHIAYLPQSPLVRGGQGANTLAVQTIETGLLRTIPLKMSYASMVRWMPDGGALVLRGIDLKGRRGLFRVDLATGQVEPIIYGSIRRYDVAPDGRTLFYFRQQVLVARDLPSGEERDLATLPSDSGLAVSPDGRWIALKPNLAGGGDRPSIQIVPASGGEPRTILTLADPDPSGWRELAWSPDGTHIIFTKGHQELWHIAAAGGTPARLAANLSLINSISVHPDGRRIAVSEGSVKGEVWLMENLTPPAPPSASRR